MPKPVPQNVQLPPIKFEAAGSSPQEKSNNLQLVLPSPGYPTLLMMVADVLLRRVDTAVFDFTQQAVAIRYLIDGLWHAMPSMDRENGDYMLATLKQICGMNYRERRLRQEGSCKAIYFDKSFRLNVISQGIPTGERVAVYVDIKKPPMETFEQMGMRPSMKQQLLPLLSAKRGMVVVCAMPTEGYTTLWRATLGACDRFMRDHYVIEPQDRAEREVINFHQMFYDESKKETWQTPIPTLLLKEPHVVAFSEFVDGNQLNEIVRLCDRPLLTLGRLYSRNAIEAIPRLLALKPDPAKLASSLSVVLCMRLVRTLCPSCKQAYPPAPQMLAKLGIPPHRIQKFYRPLPYKPGQMDAEENEILPCEECLGVGYVGRTGVFELLTITPELRAAIVSNPKVDNLNRVAQAGGHVSMRDEAILLVAKGLTGVDELQRVFVK